MLQAGGDTVLNYYRARPPGKKNIITIIPSPAVLVVEVESIL